MSLRYKAPLPVKFGLSSSKLMLPAEAFFEAIA